MISIHFNEQGATLNAEGFEALAQRVAAIIMLENDKPKYGASYVIETLGISKPTLWRRINKRHLKIVKDDSGYRRFSDTDIENLR